MSAAISIHNIRKNLAFQPVWREAVKQIDVLLTKGQRRVIAYRYGFVGTFHTFVKISALRGLTEHQSDHQLFTLAIERLSQTKDGSILAVRRVTSAAIAWLLKDETAVTLAQVAETLARLKIVPSSHKYSVVPMILLLQELRPFPAAMVDRKTGLPRTFKSAMRTHDPQEAVHDLVFVRSVRAYQKRLAKEKLTASQPNCLSLAKRMLLEKGPLHKDYLAKVLGLTPETVSCALCAKKEFIQVGQGIFDHISHHPELIDFAFPKEMTRRSWCFAVISTILRQAKEDLTTDEIMDEMRERGFLWSNSTVKALLNHKHLFQV